MRLVTAESKGGICEGCDLGPVWNMMHVCEAELIKRRHS